MSEQSVDYLHKCRYLHTDVTEIHYGRRQNLERIEEETTQIRSRDSNRLTYEDLETIRNSEVWDADQFGYWPSRSEIEEILNRKYWRFGNRQRKEEQEIATIKRLLEIFHQIETVSVILRFVDPRHYGILSPPVEQVLGIGPSRDHVTKYMTYLGNIRELKESRAFESAAEFDMALWALQLGVLEGRLKDRLPESEYRVLREGFEQDQGLKSFRMANLAPQLFGDMPRLDLAKALLQADNLQMAGQIAGCELERRVAQRVGVAPNERLELHRMISRLGDSQIRQRCLNVVEVRNFAVHRREVTRDGVRRLISAAEAVETNP